MVGCNTVQQIWDTLEKHFTLQVSSKILEFKTKLQQIKKGRMSLNEYLLKVKQMVDLLALVSEKLSARDHIATIFKGQPSKYDTFVISSNTRIEGYSVAEIEALLLSSESRIKKKDTEIDLSAHMAVQDSDINALMEANMAYRNFRQQQQPRHTANSGSKNVFRPNYHQGLVGTTPTIDVATSSNIVAQENLAAAAQETDDSWYPNFGATNHCTPNVNNLTNCTSYDGLERMYVGDGSGYSFNHKGYKYLDPTCRVYISRDVIFDENSFPYSKVAASPPISSPFVSLPTATIPTITHHNALIPEIDQHDAIDNPLPAIHINTEATNNSGQVCSMLDTGTPHEHVDQDVASSTQISSMATTPAVEPAIPSIDAPITSTGPTSAIPATTSPVISGATQVLPIAAHLPAATNNSNTHPMRTRSKAGIRKPKPLLLSRLPATVKEALLNPQWNSAMTDEILALIRNKTYTLVLLHPGRTAIGC
uniref:Retroviral polymerase SH3-like domain-containing protein n=1 Tax=Cannabis sativa TaxID=3483 RepID=A0A803NXT7_CANSA